MIRPLSLVVMAAGMGSRFGGLKQLAGFGPGNHTLLEYSLHDAIQAGFTRAVFVIRRDIEAAFRESVLSRFEHKLACQCVFQELKDLPAGHQPPEDRRKPWGTGQAVLAARDAIDGPFAVINADDLYGHDAFHQLANFFATDAADRYALVAYQLERTLSENGKVSRGLCACDASGQLVSVTEHTAIARDETGHILSGNGERFTGTEPVSMNLWGFTPKVFTSLQAQFENFLSQQGSTMTAEFYLPSAIDHDLKAGKASATLLTTTSQWHGVTYPEDRDSVSDAVAALIRQGSYPKQLW